MPIKGGLLEAFLFFGLFTLILFPSIKADILMPLHEGWPMQGGGWPVLGDIDNDSVHDIISASFASTSVFAWNGSGSNLTGWPASVSALVASYPAIGDINGDGWNEVVFGDGTGNLSVYSRDGSLLWGNDACSLTGGYIDTSPILTDLDSDGSLDILFSCHILWTSSILFTLDYTGTPVSGWETPKSTEAFMFDAAGSPAVSDIIVVAGGDATWMVPIFMQAYYPNGSEAWLTPPDLAMLSDQVIVTSPVIGNVDNDGNNEIVLTSYGDSFSEANSSKVFIIGTDGSVERSWDVPITDLLPSPTTFADLDGDSIQEIIVYWGDTLHAWKADGTLLWTTVIGGVPGSSLSPPLPVSSDIDNDGFPEIFVPVGDTYDVPRNLLMLNSSGAILMNKSFEQFLQYDYPLDRILNTPAIGDVDGDGEKEIVLTLYDEAYQNSGPYTYAFDIFTSCVESWSCSDWSVCSGGSQTRNCTDANSCGTTVNKPVESQSCTVPDTDPPIIIIYAPQTATYYSLVDIPLNYSVQDDLSEVDSVWFSLDGGANETIYGNNGNTTFNLSSYGPHNVTIYANDTTGNANSLMVTFTAESCPDADNDSFSYSACGGSDCNDSNPSINPGAVDICGNGVDEDCSGSDSACPVTEPPSSGGGSSGGGGGGYYCATNWSCTEWSSCLPNGTQTRNCTDLNKCLVAFNKPDESQNCTFVPPAPEVRLPVCGDGKCDSGESCSDCPQDCGACSPPPSNQTEGNATTEVTGQIIGFPQALDITLFVVIFALGVAVIVSFLMKKK